MKPLVGLLFMLVLAGAIALLASQRIPPLIEQIEGLDQVHAKETYESVLRLTEYALSSNDLGPLREQFGLLRVHPGVYDAFLEVGRRRRIVVATQDEWVGKQVSEVFPYSINGSEGRKWREWPVDADENGSNPRAILRIRFTEVSPGTILFAWLELLALIGAAVLMLILSSLWTGRSLVLGRISYLTKAIDAIARGNMDVRVRDGGPGAVANFARAVDRMVQDLGRNTKALRESQERFNLAVQGSNDVIWDWDVRSDRLYLSPRFASMLGIPDNEMPGLMTILRKMLFAADRERFNQELEAHLSRRTAFRAQFRISTQGGELRWFLGRGEAVRDSEGHPVRMVGAFTDISESKRAEEALFQAKERVEVTLHSISDGVATTDVEGRIQYMNPQAEKLSGWSTELARGQPSQNVLQTTDQEGQPTPSLIQEVLERKDVVDVSNTVVLVGRFGEKYFIDQSAGPIRDRSGRIIGLVMVFRNVTDRRRLRERLSQEKERAQVILSSIADAVISTDPKGRIEFMNGQAERLTGWSARIAQGKPLAEVLRVVEEQRRTAPAKDLAARVLEHGNTIASEQGLLIGRDGKEYFVDQSAAPLRNSEGQFVGVAVVFNDTTERRNLIKRLSYQASHDLVTKLVNRSEFERRMEKMIEQCEKDGRLRGVCYFDLEQFQIVSDAGGHVATDQLLIQLSRQLKEQLDQGDILARIGGDEFGVLIAGECSEERLFEKAGRLRDVVVEFRFVWEKNSFSLGASFGVVLLERGTVSVNEVMQQLDRASQLARTKGPNQIYLHSPDDSESAMLAGQMQWVNRLNRAMDEGRLILFAQPIVALDPPPGAGKHYEVLLRFKDEWGTIIGPGAFMSAAERYGLMSAIDRWVISTAIETLATALEGEANISRDVFGINISGGVLGEPDFLEFVKQTLEEHNLPPSILCLEITESVAIANLDQAIRFVDELKEMGSSFALDDFGSGFASFSYLKQLPVDFLKIDGSFVRHITKNSLDYAMVEAVNQIGHVMNLETIAEFVEDEATVNILRKLGVDYAQGYFYGKPQPLYEVCYADEDD